MKKSRTQLVQSISWQEIEKGYTELIKNGLTIMPMLDLVMHIQKTGLSNRLFASMSMQKLVIGIYEELEWNNETLHVEFSNQERKWLFTYYSGSSKSINYNRVYNEEQGIEKFDQFISNINW